jgi:hypothetical protein
MYTIESLTWPALSVAGKCAPSPQGERKLSSVEFFDNLSRFGGVTLSLPKGKDPLEPFWRRAQSRTPIDLERMAGRNDFWLIANC